MRLVYSFGDSRFSFDYFFIKIGCIFDIFFPNSFLLKSQKDKNYILSLPFYILENTEMALNRSINPCALYIYTSNPAYFSTSSEKMELAQANHSRLNSYSLSALMLSCMK